MNDAAVKQLLADTAERRSDAPTGNGDKTQDRRIGNGRLNLMAALGQDDTAPAQQPPATKST